MKSHFFKLIFCSCLTVVKCYCMLTTSHRLYFLNFLACFMLFSLISFFVLIKLLVLCYHFMLDEEFSISERCLILDFALVFKYFLNLKCFDQDLQIDYRILLIAFFFITLIL